MSAALLSLIVIRIIIIIIQPLFLFEKHSEGFICLLSYYRGT